MAIVQTPQVFTRAALERALASVVGLHTIIPADAFTAETLGTERAGNGVLIRDGLVLTIGYLITEAQTVWINLIDGRPVPGHVLGYGQGRHPCRHDAQQAAHFRGAFDVSYLLDVPAD